MKIRALFAAFLLLGVAALAQNTVISNQGKPGNQGPWPVTIAGGVSITIDGGLSITGPLVVVGPDGGAVRVQGTLAVVGLDGGSVQINGSVVGPDGGAVPVQGSVVALGPDGGAVVTQDAPCIGGRDTPFVPSTVDGGACPSAALTGRRTILLCNAPKNSTIATAPFFTLTIDGQAPSNSLYSPGQQLGLGDCISYVANDSTPVRCISDTFDAGLLITECK